MAVTLITTTKMTAPHFLTLSVLSFSSFMTRTHQLDLEQSLRDGIETASRRASCVTAMNPSSPSKTSRTAQIVSCSEFMHQAGPPIIVVTHSSMTSRSVDCLSNGSTEQRHRVPTRSYTPPPASQMPW